jgi:hypothetical protein
MNRGKFAPAVHGHWTPTRAAPAERGRPLVHSCGVGTPTRAASVGRGRPEEPFWWILGDLKGRVIRGAAIPLWGAHN